MPLLNPPGPLAVICIFVTIIAALFLYQLRAALWISAVLS